jgi:predicted membrane protein
MVLVQSTKTAGEISLKAESEGLESEEIRIETSM